MRVFISGVRRRNPPCGIFSCSARKSPSYDYRGKISSWQKSRKTTRDSRSLREILQKFPQRHFHVARKCSATSCIFPHLQHIPPSICSFFLKVCLLYKQRRACSTWRDVKARLKIWHFHQTKGERARATFSPSPRIFSRWTLHASTFPIIRVNSYFTREG